VFIVLVAVAFLMWQVVKLILTVRGRIERRRRPKLLERLRPYHHPSLPSVAEEAERWLRSNG
jgi:hypothetical protein